MNDDEHLIDSASQYLTTKTVISTPCGIVTRDEFWKLMEDSLNVAGVKVIPYRPMGKGRWFNERPANRQTGRTTRLMDFAIKHNARFVVIHERMIDYCQNIEPRMKRKMFVTINQIAERRAFCKNRRVVLDHSVVEYMNDDLCKQVHHEWEVLIPHEGEFDWRPTEMIAEDYYA